MMRPMPLDDAQKKIRQELGQSVIDYIGAAAERDELTLNIILEMLTSVLAHYIAGIPDRALRRQIFNDIGGNLGGHLAKFDEDEALPHASIELLNDGKPN